MWICAPANARNATLKTPSSKGGGKKPRDAPPKNIAQGITYFPKQDFAFRVGSGLLTVGSLG